MSFARSRGQISSPSSGPVYEPAIRASAVKEWS